MTTKTQCVFLVFRTHSGYGDYYVTIEQFKIYNPSIWTLAEQHEFIDERKAFDEFLGEFNSFDAARSFIWRTFGVNHESDGYGDPGDDSFKWWIIVPASTQVAV